MSQQQIKYLKKQVLRAKRMNKDKNKQQKQEKDNGNQKSL